MLLRSFFKFCTYINVYVIVMYTVTFGMSDRTTFIMSRSNCRLELSDIIISLTRGWRGEATETDRYLGQTGLPQNNNKYHYWSLKPVAAKVLTTINRWAAQKVFSVTNLTLTLFYKIKHLKRLNRHFLFVLSS